MCVVTGIAFATEVHSRGLGRVYFNSTSIQGKPMFHRLKKPSLLLVANLAFVTVGCKPADTAATIPSASGTAIVDDTMPATTDMVEATADDAAVNEAAADETHAAVCVLEPIAASGVAGTLNFVQVGNKVTLTGEITGLTPGEHGFHVHEKGDLSDKATGNSAGGHFNPAGHKHGKPDDAERHAGDLGNITADDKGVAKLDIHDEVISLHGDDSIVGRSIVVHESVDKFTQPTGDAGGRVAFGLIEVKE